MTNPLDLFIKNALAEVKARPKRGKAAKKLKPTETEYEINKRKLALFSQQQKLKKWTYTAVTLFVHRTSCRCCGQEITCWPDGVLITMENKLLGKHQKNISADYTPDMYPGVPRNIEYYDYEIPTCLDCFAVDSLPSDAGKQLDLFPETLHSYSEHEPLAVNKHKINQLTLELQDLEKSNG